MVSRAAVLWCAVSLFLLAPANAQSPAYGQIPLHFEENHGQTDARVRFVARGPGYGFFITDTESVAVLQKKGATPVVVRMKLIGASEHPRVEGDEPFGGKSNYLLGSDRSKWRTNVPQFGKVRMAEVYEGIDVVYYGNQGEIEYDFLVAPGSDPRQIRMQFNGADRIDIDSSGDLILRVPGGEIRQRAPFAYQVRGGVRQTVQARYRRHGAREFGFALGVYDPALPLVIDPVLAWATYLGGSDYDHGVALSVDAAGNAYVTGTTLSVNFPTANALQTVYAGGQTDAFVTKINAAGSALVYSTYLGGTGSDGAEGIAVDSSGNAFIAGDTGSADFPTVNALQPALHPPTDGFVTKLNAEGSALVYSTYLGGIGVDEVLALAIDSAGNAHVAGYTGSTDFPTANAVQATYAGAYDAFLTKLNVAGSALVYSTYLGGSGTDRASAVAVDGTGSAYVTGDTFSTNFPTVNALQSTHAGVTDAFVTKVNASGATLVYSTYVGGNGNDIALGIAVDAAANAYVGGHTRSMNFPTANAIQASNAGAEDAFATKLNPAGTAFVYSTYLGGSRNDFASGLAIDAAGNAYIAGGTASPNFPTVNAAQGAYAGNIDAFVTKLNAAGTAIVDSTYFGGTANEVAFSLAVDATGSVYITGASDSRDLPTVNALQASYGGGQADGFVARLIAESADVGIVKTATGAFVAGQDGIFTITISNAGPTAASGITLTDTIPAGATFVSATPTQGSCSGTTTVTCTLVSINSGGTATITLVVRPAADGALSNTATVTAASPDPNPANNSSTAIAQVGASANLAIAKTASAFTAGQNGTFTITVTNAGPSAASAVTVTDVLPAGATFLSAIPSQGNCSGTTTVICTLGTFANGASATIALIVRPTAAGTLSNTATVSSTTADADSANNASTALAQVEPAPAVVAIPALDGKTLLLLATLLAALAMWMTGRSG